MATAFKPANDDGADTIFAPATWFSPTQANCDTCSYGPGCIHCGGADVETSPDSVRSLVRARAEERCRMGRELHDSTSQLLVALQLRMSHLKATLDCPEHRVAFDEIDETLHDLHREIRVVSLLNNGTGLADRGLPEALRELAGKFSRMAGIEVRVAIGGHPGPGAVDLAPAVYRIAQEALANIHRHARANHVVLELLASADRLKLTIRDDGVGISTDRRRSPHHCGMGLDNIHDRVEALGGSVALRRLKRGTSIAVTLPLSREANPVLMELKR